MADQALFKIIATDGDSAPHLFVRLEPIGPETLAADLAPRIRGIYFDAAASRARLKAAAEELSQFDGSAFTEADVENAILEEIDAVVPLAWGETNLARVTESETESGDGVAGNSEAASGATDAPKKRPKQTDVQRSELGEAIAADVLGTVFSTVIPASRLAHKETPDQQTRGADVLGLENVDQPRIVLVLSEVKGSTDSKSPPGVIAGMVTKLRQLANERRVLLQELIWLRDHAEDAWKPLCTRTCSAFLLGRRTFDLLLVPVLVRTSSKAKADDCGEFATDPDSFGHPVRFLTVLVEEDLFDLAKAVYKLVRGAEAE